MFVAAYEERSFTAAAERENATQSGVSQHIRKLEERFRTVLFTREKGRVAPTPAGHTYYRSCLDVLRAHDAATKSVQFFAGGLHGEASVGLMPTMTRCVLAPSLARFTEAHPNCSIRVVEGYSGSLTQLVQSAELDFAIVPGTAGITGLNARLFMRTPEVLVASRESTSREPFLPVSPQELGPLQLVVPSRVNARRLSIESYFASNGVRVERMIELDAMFGTLDLVQRTGCVAVLPGIMMAGEDDTRRLAINPLWSPRLILDLMLIEPSRRTMSPPASAFLSILEEEGRRVNACWAAHLSETE